MSHVISVPQHVDQTGHSWPGEPLPHIYASVQPESHCNDTTSAWQDPPQSEGKLSVRGLQLRLDCCSVGLHLYLSIHTLFLFCFFLVVLLHPTTSLSSVQLHELRHHLKTPWRSTALYNLWCVSVSNCYEKHKVEFTDLPNSMHVLLCMIASDSQPWRWHKWSNPQRYRDWHGSCCFNTTWAKTQNSGEYGTTIILNSYLTSKLLSKEYFNFVFPASTSNEKGAEIIGSWRNGLPWGVNNQTQIRQVWAQTQHQGKRCFNVLLTFTYFWSPSLMFDISLSSWSQEEASVSLISSSFCSKGHENILDQGFLLGPSDSAVFPSSVPPTLVGSASFLKSFIPDGS